jgi:chromosome segregation ATPase
MRSGLFIAVFLIIMSALPAPAQTAGSADEQQSYLYEWTDNTGVVHITDSLDKIPAPYRSNARRLEAAPGEGTAPVRPRQQGAAPSPGGSEDQREAQEKLVWQRRMSDAKQRLAAAEQRYRELEQRRTALLGQWGTPAYAPPAARVEAERLSGEMQSVQKEIDSARNEVEVVIPEEARKAGVPPGWLRE